MKKKTEEESLHNERECIVVDYLKKRSIVRKYQRVSNYVDLVEVAHEMGVNVRSSEGMNFGDNLYGTVEKRESKIESNNKYIISKWRIVINKNFVTNEKLTPIGRIILAIALAYYIYIIEDSDDYVEIYNPKFYIFDRSSSTKAFDNAREFAYNEILMPLLSIRRYIDENYAEDENDCPYLDDDIIRAIAEEFGVTEQVVKIRLGYIYE